MQKRTTRGLVLIAGAAALTLIACGKNESNQKAYEACIASAKAPGSPTEKAEFAPLEKAQIAGMQDASIAVNIPYTLDGQSSLLQCSVMKEKDGTFKVQ
jgi:hypothetical protein